VSITEHFITLVADGVAQMNVSVRSASALTAKYLVANTTLVRVIHSKNLYGITISRLHV